MRRGSRLLRAAKWGGVVMCGVVIILWLASVWFEMGLNRRPYHFGLESGRFVWVNTAHDMQGSGLYARRVRSGLEWKAALNLSHCFGSHHFAPVLFLPLWMPCVGIAIVSAYLWRLDRRPLPGHCACGYDLMGNVSGVCPECGVEVQA